MSKSRAINRPSESPPQPTSEEQPLSEVSSRQKFETGGQSCTAWPCAVVIPSNRQGHSQSKGKENIAQAVAKPGHMSKKKKKKGKSNSGSSTSKPRRQQAPREKKLAQSIEHSPRNVNSSSTLDSGTDGAGSDYLPSSTDLPYTSLSSASNTPLRPDPGRRLSRGLNVNAVSSTVSGSASDSSRLRLSPPADGSLPVLKQETSPSLETAVTARSPSLALWNSPLRRKKYKKNQCVEIPREVYEYKKTKRATKGMLQQLAAKKEAILLQRAMRDSAGGSRGSSKKRKRRLENEVEQEQYEPCKRQKTLKPRKPDQQDHPITDEDNKLTEEPQQNKKRKVRRYTKGQSTKNQAKKYQAVVAEAQGRLTVTDTRSNLPRAQSSIAPQEFYGNKGEDQHPANVESSLRSTWTARETNPSPESHFTPGTVKQPKVTNGCMPSKALRVQGQSASNPAGPPVSQSPRAARASGPNSYLTPPNSSPLGKSCSANMPSKLHPLDDIPSEQENLEVRQIPKAIPQAPRAMIQAQRHFYTQHPRHRSMTVNLPSRNRVVHKQSNTLQEISNNPTLQDIERRFVSVLEKVLQERLPVTPQIQNAQVQPADTPAPTPSVTTPAQGETQAGQRPARRKRKKLSLAERKRKYPALERNAPAHPDLSDKEILEIGRIVNPYERHRRAQQAFSWRGRLYTGYKRLLKPIVDGVPGWTPAEIRRVNR